ncbi:DUF4080 domain-containing protein [Prosthecobacter sp.]|uniref:B12-binding domain-containing radical SAM protein n=1 Tax=Prosthecobacter sp. TaxID=1965333 RepID=UPI002AB942DE|nr:DUF4080 domain-containing protein [Prosthecobacter sp.]MDZ4402499.1 DUF4080 domain-containing protein [Prosthecobacter sp.]
MPDIVLATLNAKYIHASFGLRCLMANLGELRERACMAEFIINQPPLEIVEAILAHKPRIVGFGVYIWNVEQTTEVVALLKRLRPELIIILGGPEVSYETEGQEIVALADHVITGEADMKFAQVCRELLGFTAEGQRSKEAASDSAPLPLCPSAAKANVPKIIAAELPALNQLASPYELYTDEDLKHRVIYVEASRGCPFTCEFCLSSLDIPVRAFATDAFLAAMQRLLDRETTQFKFVDRTFNLHLPTSMGILQFFLDRWRDGLFLHFEMVPDRLPEQLRALIRRFPPGAVQFEVGIQTFDDATSKNISRRQNLDRLEDNFRFLREETGVHIHADLIVGLPGEGIESFGRGFDRLVRLNPQEIQVGILKRLRGTPIVRHDDEYRMIYAPHPPYEILSTRDISFADMQRMRRFARYWDIVANSGNFTNTLMLLWRDGASPFVQFLRFSDWLHATLRRTHQIALHVIAQNLFDFLITESGVDRELAAAALEADWHRTPSREALNLRGMTTTPALLKPAAVRTARRQERHTQLKPIA